MQSKTSQRSKLVIGVALLAFSIPTQTFAQTLQTVVPSGVVSPTTDVSYQAFAPKPSRDLILDYSLLDEILKTSVMYGGPSLRRRASRPDAQVGTRFAYGHTSPYRLEGNKVVFEYMNDDFNTMFSAYADDLVEIGNRLDIASLPRNEQLAYWLNLHNVLLIREVAKAYPVSNPSRIKGADGARLHDTLVATIDGVPLSLRAIREDIVYANWSDPRVIYGFFQGDIGSPAIRRKAFTGDNVWSILTDSAKEFSSSLRGVERFGDEIRVSKLYADTARWYFPNFEGDVRAHLMKFGSEESVADIRAARKPIKIARYETDTADLTAGDLNQKSYSQVLSTQGDIQRLDRNPVLARFVREQRQKYNDMRERGLTGTVIIEDIETEPEQLD